MFRQGIERIQIFFKEKRTEISRYTDIQDFDFTEIEDVLGDAMDMFGCDNIDEDEVLSSARFGITEMEDVLGDTLDEMDDNDEW